MGRMSRNKGAAGEREVAHLFESYGYKAKRGCQHRGGPNSPDVDGVPGLHIEVKRTEKLALYEAMEQSQRDCGEGELPIVVHRRNGKKWVVCMRFEDFMQLYKKWQEEKP